MGISVCYQQRQKAFALQTLAAKHNDEYALVSDTTVLALHAGMFAKAG